MSSGPKVDVLEVMDHEIARWPNIEQYADGKRLIEARAAVAELIEAARMVDDNIVLRGTTEGKAIIAALARVVGAA